MRREIGAEREGVGGGGGHSNFGVALLDLAL